MIKLQQVYAPAEVKIFSRLKTPKKIQDFLETLKINFETNGETCMSPRFVLKTGKAHCMEAAMFAAAALEFHGQKPLLMDLRSVKPHDDDHVVALFRQYGFWGAISKTNHAVLRYREPIYKTIRELAMSYFHEYFMDNGKKTLREYSIPFDLNTFAFPALPLGKGRLALRSLLARRSFSEVGGEGGVRVNWRTHDEDLFAIPHHLDKIKHYKILSLQQIRNLRKADDIEIKAGKLVEWKNK